jgi:autophagy-related protein 5
MGGEDHQAAGDGAHATAAAAVDSAAALSKAWCNAEHCLPLDDVVRREVWEGSIPIRLELASQDVSTFEPPMPFYLQAPRMAYLPMALAAAKTYFANYVPSVSCTEREMWAEYKNIPLRWHLPTGVLYDLFAHGDELPWGLTLHFSGVEAKGLLPYENESTIKRHFRQALKEATCLRYGSCKRVNNLSKAQMEQLWTALSENKFDSFAPINAELLRMSQAGPAGLAEIKRLPVRVMLPHLQSPIQHPMLPYKDDGSLLTLGEALSLVLPALFPKDKVDDDVGEGNGSDDDRPVVIVQGIEAPLSTPALWLCQQLASADTMLYISVRPAVSGSNADTS